MRRILTATALCALAALALTPGQASVKRKIVYRSYSRSYAAPSTTGVAFKFDPAALTDPGLPATVNPATKVSKLKGTQADQNFGVPGHTWPLYRTPADQNIGGVVFAAGSYKGTPYRLKIADALGGPIAWTACQLRGSVPICGENPEDISVYHCTDGDPPAGALLHGFKAGAQIDIWISVNDSTGIFNGTPCDGVASQGTVTLVTAS
jgi:hypothetical protein